MFPSERKQPFEWKKTTAFTKNTLHQNKSYHYKERNCLQNEIPAGTQPFPFPSLKASQPHQAARPQQIYPYKFKQHNSTFLYRVHTYTPYLSHSESWHANKCKGVSCILYSGHTPKGLLRSCYADGIQLGLVCSCYWDPKRNEIQVRCFPLSWTTLLSKSLC